MCKKTICPSSIPGLMHVFFSTNLRLRHVQPPSKTKAAVEAVVYHAGNESGLIGCIPETAMIHCLLLARDQPLNNVYHCLPGLFNYPANVIGAAARGPRVL